jgi:hypothetical protein
MKAGADMQSLDDSLAKLVAEKKVTREEALERASDKQASL